MTKKKKETVQEPITKTVKPIIENKIETSETPMFQIVTYSEVYLRAKPLLDNNNKNLIDRMVKGKIYDVISVIHFSVKKMYYLKEGYYVIADEVKIV